MAASYNVGHVLLSLRKQQGVRIGDTLVSPMSDAVTLYKESIVMVTPKVSK